MEGVVVGGGFKKQKTPGRKNITETRIEEKNSCIVSIEMMYAY